MVTVEEGLDEENLEDNEDLNKKRREKLYL